jgi:hypothetical protein
MSTREKAGKIFADLRAKRTLADRTDSTQLMRLMGKDIMEQLHAEVEKVKSKYKKDFYIEFCIKKPLLISDLPEWYCIDRHTAPTPFPDRGCFKYSFSTDTFEFLWHVPSHEEMNYYLNNKHNLTKPEQEAFNDVLKYLDGSLLRLAKKLNNEVNDYELIFYRKDLNGQPTAS